MSDSPAYDLFISYAVADCAWVEGYLLDMLAQAGISYHYEAAFALGVPRLLEFERAVQESRRTLLVLSPAYFAHDESRLVEVLAHQYGLDTATWPVIPLLLHLTKLPLILKSLTALDATKPADWPKAMKRLCEIFQRPTPSMSIQPPCPYPGMLPFTEANNNLFFGREAEENELLHHLRLHPFIAIIGRSGSGKSSLVYAGLIKALRQSNLFGSGEWLISTVRPGDHPLSALSMALGGNLDDLERAINSMLSTVVSAEHLLLIVDQFEEIYTLATAADPAEVLEFQSVLQRIANLKNCYLVLTVRADFYPELLVSPLWREIRNHRLEVTPLDDDGLRQAVVRPAEQINVHIEPTLVERLVLEAAGEPGVLPWLQETLVLLWEKLERRYLPLQAYMQLTDGSTQRSGLEVALARRADTAFASLTDPQRTIARRIMVRLVQFIEGRDDTRRQQPVSALRTADDDSDTFNRTLKHLVGWHLLVLSGTEEVEPKVDLAHEALIYGWPKFRNWLSEQREAEQIRRLLESKATDWVRLGSGDGGLLDKTQLREAEQWLKRPEAMDLGASTNLLALIDASRVRISPGWHLWGTVGLLVTGVAIAALLGLLYLVTEDQPTTIKIALWLALGTVLGLIFFASDFLRSLNRDVGQRLSQKVALHRSWQWSLSFISVSAILLWSIFGVGVVRTNQICARAKFEKPGAGAVHLAVIDPESKVDPYHKLILSDVLSRFYQIRTWNVTTVQADQCEAFFTHQLAIEATPPPNTIEVAYVATLLSDTKPNQPPLKVIGKDEECLLFASLGHEVAGRIKPEQAATIVPGSTSPLPTLCEPFNLVTEGYTALRQPILESNLLKAEEQLRRATSIAPDFSEAHINLGHVYLYLGKYPEAVNEFKVADQLTPNRAIVNTSLGLACFYAGDFACAKDRNLAVVNSQDNLPSSKFAAHNNQSLVYRAQRLYDKAADELKHAEALLQFYSDEALRDQDERIMHKNQGILAFNQGYWKEAIYELDQSYPRSSRYREEIFYYLARSYTQLGEKQLACESWADYNESQRSYLFEEDERRKEAVLQQRMLGC